MHEENRGAKLVQDLARFMKQCTSATEFEVAWRAHVDSENDVPLSPEEASAFRLGLVGIILGFTTDIPVLA